MPATRYGLGWKPDLPDKRDCLFSAPQAVMEALPPAFSLRSKMPPIVDQGSLGSCTANAIGYAHRYLQMLLNPAHWMPSRLFIYYNERDMEGTVPVDAGAMIRDGIKSVAQQGCPPESLWPYNTSAFRDKPPVGVYSEALKSQAFQYRRIPMTKDRQANLQNLKSAIASGFPFVFGFTVYDSFMSQTVARTGIMPMPSRLERVQGGHAVTACAFDDASEYMDIQNSWSVNWGDQGHFKMPYAFISDPDFCQDFWVLQGVEIDDQIPTSTTTTQAPAPPVTTLPPTPPTPAPSAELQALTIGTQEIFVRKGTVIKW